VAPHGGIRPAGIDACGTRGDFQRCYGTSIGPVDRQTAWPVTLDGEPGNEPQWRLTPLIRKTQPYAKKIAHPGFWVEPELLAEIDYRAKSAEGKVRHLFFKGLREDL
jgi:ATP dependent DNA ligase C terminal region